MPHVKDGQSWRSDVEIFRKALTVRENASSFVPLAPGPRLEHSRPLKHVVEPMPDPGRAIRPDNRSSCTHS